MVGGRPGGGGRGVRAGRGRALEGAGLGAFPRPLRSRAPPGHVQAPGELVVCVWGGARASRPLTRLTRGAGPSAGNRKFENAHKAQLNEAEWSPLLFGGLALLAVKGVDAELCAELCAFGSVWYLWSRAVGGGINGEPLVLPGGLTRYFGGMLLAYEVVALGFG